MYSKPEDPFVLMETIRSQLQDAKKHEGKDRRPKDPRALMANHYAAIPEGKKHRNQDPSILVKVDVYEPYLPCTKALQELELMEVSELRRETHHRGKYLMVRQMGEHSRGNIHVTAVVRDATGSFENLMFDTVDIALPERDIMPLNAVMVVQEPFYTHHQQLKDVLCIDHPSDLIYLSITDVRVTLPLLTREEAAWRKDRTALQWKEAGNAALKAGRNLDAAAWYSCGMLVVGTSEAELKKTLYRNRAQANLKLMRLDAAEADAMAAVQGDDESSKDLDYKALFRAGLAAYSLRDFARAKKHIEHMLGLKPGDRDGLHLFKLLMARLHEKSTGLYNFADLAGKIRAGASRLDVADYINNTEVKSSPGRGRGLFATVDMKPGDLVTCEKAFCLSLENDSDYFQGADFCLRDGHKGCGAGRKWKNAINTLYRNPSKIPAVTSLAGKHAGVGNEVVKVDGTAVVDMFQIYDIFWRNMYAAGTTTPAQPDTQFGFIASTPMNAGIWLHSSYLNHSCVPDIKHVTIGDLLVYRAARPIVKGEEITSMYTYEENIETRHSNQKKT